MKRIILFSLLLLSLNINGQSKGKPVSPSKENEVKPDAEAQQAKLAAQAKAKADEEARQIKLAALEKSKADIETASKAKLAADAYSNAERNVLVNTAILKAAEYNSNKNQSEIGNTNFKTNISDLVSKAFLGSEKIAKAINDDPTISLSSDCVKPKTLTELDGGYDIFFSSNHYVLETGGTIVFVTGNVNNSKSTMSYKFLQYKKEKCIINGKEEEVLYGCGIDLNLDIVSKKKSVNFNSLPKIAAAVTYKDADVQYKIKIIGITGNPIRNSLSVSGEFDVDNYAKIMSKIDEIVNKMGDTGVNIAPQIIGTEKAK